MKYNKSLKTPFESDGSSYEEYPRPQLKRDSYMSLCGEWELSVKTKNEVTSIGKINVPFPVESRLSGIERMLKKGESYVYSRTFRIESGFDA